LVRATDMSELRLSNYSAAANPAISVVGNAMDQGRRFADQTR
jgi:hypothetical protein